MDFKLNLANNVLLEFNHLAEAALADARPRPAGEAELVLYNFHFSLIEPDFRVLDHSHPYYEIAFVRRGGLTQTTPAGKFACTPQNGNIFIIPPGVVHSRVFSPEAGNINNTFICDLKAETPEGIAQCARLPEILAQKQYHVTADEALLAANRLVDAQINLRQKADPRLTASLLNLFVRLLLQQLLPAGGETGGNGRLAFQTNRALAIKAYIERSLNGNCRLRNCAKFFEMSEQHLNRIFAAETGMTIHAWHRMRRLELAKTMLLTTHIPVGEVASALFFTGQSEFTRFFKKECQISPSAFRLHHSDELKTPLP